MAINNYFDFAEDDYKYFVDSCNRGLIADSMGLMHKIFVKIFKALNIRI